MQGSLFIVDALNFLYRAFHALPPLTSSRGTPTGALYGLCQMLLRIEREHRPTHLCVVLDAPGRTFRDDMYTAYKANRPPMPPELASQVALVPRVIQAFGLPTLCVPGVEADDTMATLALAAAAAEMRVMICSADKDLMQLVNDRIQILDTMKNRVFGRAEVIEKFGVPPERVGDVLALMGDTADNVPGVAGIGPKTAAQLVNEFGSLDGLLGRLSEVKGKKGETLALSRDVIALSRRLVTLKTDVELPGGLADVKRRDPDHGALVNLFRDLEFSRLLTQELVAAGAVSSTPVAPVTAPTPAPTESLVPVVAVPESGPVRLVTDTAALDQLVAALRESRNFGLALFTEGGDAPRADFVGLAFALPTGDRFYLPLGHRLLGGPPSLREAASLPRLAPVFADPTISKSIYESKFLAVMLGLRGIDLQGVTADPLLGAYVLDPSRATHPLDVLAVTVGLTDVVARAAWIGTGRQTQPPAEIPVDVVAAPLTREASAVLSLGQSQLPALESSGLSSLYLSLELPLSQVLARVEQHGVLLDTAHLRSLGDEVTAGIDALETQIYALAGTEFNVASPKQLAQILFERLGLPVIRRTKTGPSTDADVLEELAALHEVPAKVVEHRTLSKLKGTYIDALPLLVNPRTGRLHTTFNQAVAATGRLSSSDPNLQNIPIRTDLGRRIREAFIASPGHQIVSADYSQIELRILAHFSGDPAFLAAFRAGADIHQRTAAEVFGIAPDAVTSDQRRIAKAINFGLVFGQTDFGLAQALRIPRGTARDYIANYFARYSGVRTYMDRAIADARVNGVVTTLLGRRRPLPGITAARAPDRAYAERIARNTPIQGSAADLLKLAMIRVDQGLRDQWPQIRLLLTVHDELVFEVPNADVDGFIPWVKFQMESVGQGAVALDVPLVVDVGAGRTWGQAH